MTVPRWKAELAVIQAICALYWCPAPRTKRLDEAFARATGV